MTDQNRPDMKISGAVSPLPGGTYGDLVINGAGSVNGDIDARDVRVNGAGGINGALVAQTVTVNGTGTFNGSVQAGEFTVNGDAGIRDGAGIGRLTVKGNTSIGGGLAAHDIVVKGFLKAAGDCEAESFSAEGGFTVGGLLNAGTVDIKVYGSCSAREIGGESITVRASQGFESITQLLTFWTDKRLTVDSIEGDDISLEATVAKSVRGTNVTVGDGCRIDLVEYTESYTPLAGAEVKEARRVEAPREGAAESESESESE